MSTESPIVAVVGATGAVGREVLSILAERGHPRGAVVAFASDRSSGLAVPFGEGSVQTRALSHAALREADIAIFASSAEVAVRFAPGAAGAGVLCVDNSSAFRADPDVPLVVPEVNAGALAEGRAGGIVASPNCSTILLLVAIEPIRRAFGVEQVVVSTYQAVSGAGLAGMRELDEQAKASVEGRELSRSVFPEQCLFNCFVHESEIDPRTGFNGEEAKIIAEAGKIWGLGGGAPIVPTCIRVPVRRAHAESVFLRTSRPATIEQVRAVLRAGEGLELAEGSSAFPTPLRAGGGDRVLVGHLRRSPTARFGAGGGADEFVFWLCGDQLRKGAALNAVQIAAVLFPSLGAGRGGGRSRVRSVSVNDLVTT